MKKKMDLDTAVTLIMGEIQKLATKDELIESEKRIEKRIERIDDRVDGLAKKMDDGFTAVISRMGGQDNRIDNESVRRIDLENRVRAVVPSLPITPERV